MNRESRKGASLDILAVRIEMGRAQRNPSIAVASGVHPTLAALEMLRYPKSALTIANTTLAQLGKLEITPLSKQKSRLL